MCYILGMGYEYALSFRERVVLYVDAGHGGKAEAARVFGITRQSVHNWFKQRRRKGHLKPLERGGRQRHLDRQRLMKYLNQHADAYLSEIGAHFGVSDVAIFKACKRWKITRKKNLILQRKRREKERGVSTRHRPAR